MTHISLFASLQLTYQHVAKSPTFEEISSSVVDFTGESLYFAAAHLGASFVGAILQMLLPTLVFCWCDAVGLHIFRLPGYVSAKPCMTDLCRPQLPANWSVCELPFSSCVDAHHYFDITNHHQPMVCITRAPFSLSFVTCTARVA